MTVIYVTPKINLIMHNTNNIPSVTFVILFKHFCDQLPQFKKTIIPDGLEKSSYYSFYNEYAQKSYEYYRYERRDSYILTKARFKNYPKLIPPLMSFEEYKENAVEFSNSEDYFFLATFARLVYDFVNSHPSFDEKNNTSYFTGYGAIDKALDICWDYLNEKPIDPFYLRARESPFFYIETRGSRMDFIPFYRVLFQHFDDLPGTSWSYQHRGLRNYIMTCWQQYHYESIDSPYEIDRHYIENLNPYHCVKNWRLLREQLISSSEFVLLANMEKDLIKIINKINGQKPHDLVYAHTEVFGDYPPGYVIDPDQYVYA